MSASDPSPVPGVPCPGCGHPITVSLAELISGAPIHCRGCGGSLTVDPDQSHAVLDAVRELAQRLEEIRQQTDGAKG